MLAKSSLRRPMFSWLRSSTYGIILCLLHLLQVHHMKRKVETTIVVKMRALAKKGRDLRGWRVSALNWSQSGMVKSLTDK